MNQTKGLTRNTIDKFYTKKTIVDLCIDHITRHVHIDPSDLIIEPSAGNGIFVDGIRRVSNNVMAYDIDPERDDIVKQDYLLYDYELVCKTYNKIHVIGNPPFGRQSSMALKFIKKSNEFCNSISFILPKSFKKESMRSRIPSFFHLVFETDLPMHSFSVNGIDHDVPCVFQIWEKKDVVREPPPRRIPIGYVFVNHHDNADISFRRVGVNAGMIDIHSLDTKSPQTHYFIRFTNRQSIPSIISTLSNLIFDDNNTVGPKSISKQEIIQAFNSCIQYGTVSVNI
jgi:predicted RNA methylase